MINRPLVIAHRGASVTEPENTLPAFQAAWAAGAEGIECDVQLTADKQIVCCHDLDLERVAGKALKVAEETAATLQTLDVGSWKGASFSDARMPLLSEVLALVPSGKRIYIEVKSGKEIVPHLLEVLSASTIAASHLVVMCFDAEVVKAMKQQNPKLVVFLLVDAGSNWLGKSKLKVDEVVDEACAMGANGLGLKVHASIDRKLAERIRNADLLLNIWTIDDSKEARRIASCGVTSLTTNDPKAIRLALA